MPRAQRSVLTVLAVFGTLCSGCASNYYHNPSELGALAKSLTPDISFSKAVSIAEEQSGGVAFEAEIEKENGTLIYSVCTFQPGSESELTINAKTGNVIEVESEAGNSDELNLYLQLAHPPKLQGIIELAEDSGNGQLVAISFEFEDDAVKSEAEFGSPQDTHEYELDLDARTVSPANYE